MLPGQDLLFEGSRNFSRVNHDLSKTLSSFLDDFDDAGTLFVIFVAKDMRSSFEVRIVPVRLFLPDVDPFVESYHEIDQLNEFVADISRNVKVTAAGELETEIGAADFNDFHLEVWMSSDVAEFEKEMLYHCCNVVFVCCDVELKGPRRPSSARASHPFSLSLFSWFNFFDYRIFLYTN